MIYVKAYGFLSFAKNMGKSWSNNYGQKLLDSAKKSTTDAIKGNSKNNRTGVATGDLIGNKIVDKITSVSTGLHSKKKSDNDNNHINNKNNDNNNNNNKNNNNEDAELKTYKKRYIFPEERQQIINDLRLVPKKDEYF